MMSSERVFLGKPSYALGTREAGADMRNRVISHTAVPSSDRSHQMTCGCSALSGKKFLEQTAGGVHDA